MKNLFKHIADLAKQFGSIRLKILMTAKFASMKDLPLMRRLLLLLVPVLFLIRCTHPKEAPDNKTVDVGMTTIKIDCDAFKKENLGLSPYLEKLTFIPLETTEECMIGKIEKVVYFDNQYIIADGQTKKILVFDDHGKFVRVVGKKGKGPNEYRDLKDISVSIPDSSIVVLGSTKPVRFVSYSLNGKNTSEVSYGHFSAEKFYKSGQHYIIYNNDPTKDNHGFNLLITDSAGGILSRHLPFVHYTDKSLGGRQTFYFYDDHVGFYMPLNDTIYQISKDNTVSKRYLIDFGENKLPKDIAALFAVNFEQYASQSAPYVDGFDDVVETNDYIFFEYGFNGHGLSVYYSKVSKQIKQSYYYDDLLEGILLSPIAATDDDLIAELQPSQLLEMIDYLKQVPDKQKTFFKKHPYFEKLYPKLNELSNPVLVRYKLKPF